MHRRQKLRVRRDVSDKGRPIEATGGSQEPKKGSVRVSGDDSGRETTRRRQSTTDPQNISKKNGKTGPNNMSHPESVHSPSPSLSQASPDHLQAAIDQALNDRWNQLAQHVEAHQSELNRRVQTQLEEKNGRRPDQGAIRATNTEHHQANKAPHVRGNTSRNIHTMGVPGQAISTTDARP